METYPEDMMRALRVKSGVDPTDESKDKDIMRMSVLSVVRACAGFYLGGEDWANQVLRWHVEALHNPNAPYKDPTVRTVP